MICYFFLPACLPVYQPACLNWLPPESPAITTCPLAVDLLVPAQLFVSVAICLPAGQRISVPFAIILGVRCTINCVQSRLNCGKLMRRGDPICQLAQRRNTNTKLTNTRSSTSYNRVIPLLSCNLIGQQHEYRNIQSIWTAPLQCFCSKCWPTTQHKTTRHSTTTVVVALVGVANC